MAEVDLSEQQGESQHSDQVTTMCAYVSAAAKRALVAKEDLLAKAGVHADPTNMFKALYTELEIWH
eukprot:4867852-Pyramimonas_sp.AAC.1